MDRVWNEMSYHWLATELEHPAHKPRLDEIEVNRSVAKYESDPDTLHEYLDDKDPQTRVEAMRSPDVDSSHLDKAQNDSYPSVRRRVFMHPSHVQPHHIDKALDDSDIPVKLKALDQLVVEPHHIDKALNDKSYLIRAKALEHASAVRDHHITKGLLDPDPGVSKEAAKRGAARFDPTNPVHQSWVDKEYTNPPLLRLKK